MASSTVKSATNTHNNRTPLRKLRGREKVKEFEKFLLQKHSIDFEGLCPEQKEYIINFLQIPVIESTDEDGDIYGKAVETEDVQEHGEIGGNKLNIHNHVIREEEEEYEEEGEDLEMEQDEHEPLPDFGFNDLNNELKTKYGGTTTFSRGTSRQGNNISKRRDSTLSTTSTMTGVSTSRRRSVMQSNDEFPIEPVRFVTPVQVEAKVASKLSELESDKIKALTEYRDLVLSNNSAQATAKRRFSVDGASSRRSSIAPMQRSQSFLIKQHGYITRNNSIVISPILHMNQQQPHQQSHHHQHQHHHHRRHSSNPKNNVTGGRGSMIRALSSRMDPKLLDELTKSFSKIYGLEKPSTASESANNLPPSKKYAEFVPESRIYARPDSDSVSGATPSTASTTTGSKSGRDSQTSISSQTQASTSQTLPKQPKEDPTEEMKKVTTDLENWVTKNLEAPEILKVITDAKVALLNSSLANNEFSTLNKNGGERGLAATKANIDSASNTAVNSTGDKPTSLEGGEFDILLNACKPTILENKLPIKLNVVHETHPPEALVKGLRDQLGVMIAPGNNAPGGKHSDKTKTKMGRGSGKDKGSANKKDAVASHPQYGAWFLPPSKWDDFRKQRLQQGDIENEKLQKLKASSMTGQVKQKLNEIMASHAKVEQMIKNGIMPTTSKPNTPDKKGLHIAGDLNTSQPGRRASTMPPENVGGHADKAKQELDIKQQSEKAYHNKDSLTSTWRDSAPLDMRKRSMTKKLAQGMLSKK